MSGDAPAVVVVGHVTLDRFPDGARPGGAALYAAVAAHRLGPRGRRADGLSVGLLTSHGPGFPGDALPRGISIAAVPADATTEFEHREVEGRRELRLLARARALGPGDLPESWRAAAVVVLAPVAGEVDPELALAFDDAAVTAIAQGWLRRTNPEGRVAAAPWVPPSVLLGSLDALVVSAEDVGGRERAVVDWFDHVPVGVVTLGAAGANLWVNGERSRVAARPAARVVDTTGAGDVFAAVLAVRRHLGDDPWQAAEAAACAASLAVEGIGCAAVPDRATLEAALDRWRRDLA